MIHIVLTTTAIHFIFRDAAGSGGLTHSRERAWVLLLLPATLDTFGLIWSA